MLLIRFVQDCSECIKWIHITLCTKLHTYEKVCYYKSHLPLFYAACAVFPHLKKNRSSGILSLQNHERKSRKNKGRFEQKKTSLVFDFAVKLTCQYILGIGKEKAPCRVGARYGEIRLSSLVIGIQRCNKSFSPVLYNKLVPLCKG